MLPALIGVAVGLLVRFLILYIRKRNQAKRSNPGAIQPLPTPKPWQPPKAVAPAGFPETARTLNAGPRRAGRQPGPPR
jgi:hypothetical protein